MWRDSTWSTSGTFLHVWNVDIYERTKLSRARPLYICLVFTRFIIISQFLLLSMKHTRKRSAHWLTAAAYTLSACYRAYWHVSMTIGLRIFGIGGFETGYNPWTGLIGIDNSWMADINAWPLYVRPSVLAPPCLIFSTCVWKKLEMTLVVFIINCCPLTPRYLRDFFLLPSEVSMKFTPIWPSRVIRMIGRDIFCRLYAMFPIGWMMIPKPFKSLEISPDFTRVLETRI